jgi:hypothetical protein
MKIENPSACVTVKISHIAVLLVSMNRLYKVLINLFTKLNPVYNHEYR